MGNIFSIVHDSTFCPPTVDYNEFAQLNTFFINDISCIIAKPTRKIIRDKVIIFSHGNGCDLSSIYPFLVDIANYHGIVVVGYDYPGYGLSVGYPTENSCNHALDTVISHFDNYEIILMGHSLGTGVCVSYCYYYNYNPYLLILVSPFKSIIKTVVDSDIVEYTSISSGASTFRTISNIEYISSQIKIYHGCDDELFSQLHAHDIFNKVKDRCILTLLKGVGHNDILSKLLLPDFLEFNTCEVGSRYI